MVTNDQSRIAATPRSWADPTVTPPRRERWRRVLPLVVWMGCLAGALVLLRVLGDGRLAAPSLADPGAWAPWAAARDPLEVAMVVLRLLALGLAWYLTGVTSISVVARMLRAARLVRIADALSFGPVKVLVQQALGIGLAAGVLATAVPAPPTAPVSGDADAPDVALLAPLAPDDVPADLPLVSRTTAAAGSQVALVRDATPTGRSEVIVPVPAPTSPGAATPTDAAPPTDAAAPTDAAPPGGAAPASEADETPDPTPAPAEPSAAPSTRPAPVTEQREVRIEPGDHFWALAERDLAEVLGRPATDSEVVPHWQAILEANADRLQVPGNPDLLLPGQLVVLPPVVEVSP